MVWDNEKSRALLARFPSMHPLVMRADEGLAHVLSETLDCLLQPNARARLTVPLAHESFRRLHRAVAVMERVQQSVKANWEGESEVAEEDRDEETATVAGATWGGTTAVAVEAGVAIAPPGWSAMDDGDLTPLEEEEAGEQSEASSVEEGEGEEPEVVGSGGSSGGHGGGRGERHRASK